METDLDDRIVATTITMDTGFITTTMTMDLDKVKNAIVSVPYPKGESLTSETLSFKIMHHTGCDFQASRRSSSIAAGSCSTNC